MKNLSFENLFLRIRRLYLSLPTEKFREQEERKGYEKQDIKENVVPGVNSSDDGFCHGRLRTERERGKHR